MTGPPWSPPTGPARRLHNRFEARNAVSSATTIAPARALRCRELRMSWRYVCELCHMLVEVLTTADWKDIEAPTTGPDVVAAPCRQSCRLIGAGINCAGGRRSFRGQRPAAPQGRPA